MVYIKKRLLHLTFVIFLATIYVQLHFSKGIKCYECGKLEVVPSTGNSKCDKYQSEDNYPPTCRYYLSPDSPIKRSSSLFSSDELKSPLQLSNTEVCYTLHGEFRGGSLVMRGCDAMPINQLDMDSNTTERCFDWSVKLWFETEVGIEYINRTRLCICNTDYCNFEGDQGGSVTRKPFVGLLTVFVVILGYFVI